MTDQEAQLLRNKLTEIHAKFPAWVSYGHNLKSFAGSELKILLYICSRAHNITHRALPNTCTREKIHLGTGVSLGTISGIITGLVTRGIIYREREGRNNTYCVQFEPPEPWPLPGPTNETRAAASPRRREPLSRNLPQYQHNHLADVHNPPPTSLPARDPNYSDSGLYKEQEKDSGIDW